MKLKVGDKFKFADETTMRQIVSRGIPELEFRPRLNSSTSIRISANSVFNFCLKSQLFGLEVQVVHVTEGLSIVVRRGSLPGNTFYLTEMEYCLTHGFIVITEGETIAEKSQQLKIFMQSAHDPNVGLRGTWPEYD